MTMCNILIDKATAMVEINNAIMGGTPVIRGTRIPVYQVAGLVKSGASMSEVLEDYPSLTEDQVKLAVIYVDATPSG